MTRYSLWLIPSGETYNKLLTILCHLSEKFSSFRFEPHVTLIGGVLGRKNDILLKTSQIASKIDPFQIRLTRVEYQDEFFRCLYIRVGESQEIINANLIARKILSRLDDPEYMPHLSLIYGDLPVQRKEEIIKEIGEEFNISFEVTTIHLFSTSYKLKNWHRIQEFPFKK